MRPGQRGRGHWRAWLLGFPPAPNGAAAPRPAPGGGPGGADGAHGGHGRGRRGGSWLHLRRPVLPAAGGHACLLLQKQADGLLPAPGVPGRRCDRLPGDTLPVRAAPQV
uniref:Uncharacterized protein n=1 Tax=Ixodes ricinus TaxID=34613 RepID=A0A6B0UHE8_IXORI